MILDLLLVSGLIQSNKKGSFLEKLFLFLERYLIKNADGIVVLDKSGGEFLNNFYKTNTVFKVIPTATDISKYQPKIQEQDPLIKFVYVGGVQYPYLTLEALIFVKQLFELGFNCRIDFINKGDHKLIKNLSQKICFPKEILTVFEKPNEKIPTTLINYDCGLLFLAEGHWLKMCSPTKIGEYLAAGLFIISLEGINVTDRFSKKYDCISLLRRNFLNQKISFGEAEAIVKKIKSPGRRKHSRDVALNHYDMNKALDSYFDLYNTIKNLK